MTQFHRGGAADARQAAPENRVSAHVTEALKPCPLCGGEAVVHSREFTDDKADLGNAYIECADCHIETAYYRTEAEGVAAWNTRHREQATAELVAGLEQAATWFDEYAFDHGCKATQTADDAEIASRLAKAKRNKERANHLRQALAKHIDSNREQGRATAPVRS